MFILVRGYICLCICSTAETRAFVVISLKFTLRLARFTEALYLQTSRYFILKVELWVYSGNADN